MTDCKYQGCRHHTERTRYRLRPLLCRLSIHRHWGDGSGSPPPWTNACIQCGYDWIRCLNSRVPERQRWAWWRRAPWPIRRLLRWLSNRAYRHSWIRVQALIDNDPA